MMKLKLFHTGATVVLLLLSAIAAAAQVVEISGKVTLKKADGTVVPVSGAVVDIYRTDIKQKFEALTDRRGEYMRAGLPMVGTYTIAVSAAGARPDYHAGIRLTQQPVNDFALLQGDGSRLTLEQITAMAGGPARQIEEKNREIQRINETVARTFSAGNQALNAGQLDEAIAQFREGVAARVDEPALLTNLAEALRRRGDSRFNAAVNQKTPEERFEGQNSAKKDWSEAAQLSRKAVDIIKSVTPEDPGQQQSYLQNRRAAHAVYARSMSRVASKVDNTQASAAWQAAQQYIAIETDPATKIKIRDDALQMLLDAGSDSAIIEARKILATEPNHLGANRVLGLALVASGNEKNLQEAADHLQRYVDLAPDTDTNKQLAKDAIDNIKTLFNIQPRTKRRP